MERRGRIEAARRTWLEERREALRNELERRGVGAEFAEATANSLVAFSPEFGDEQWESVLAGVVLAYGVHRRSVETFRRTAEDLEEVQRLLQSFGGELRKLDEALELLAAYAVRLRAQTRVPADRTLH